MLSPNVIDSYANGFVVVATEATWAEEAPMSLSCPTASSACETSPCS